MRSECALRTTSYALNAGLLDEKIANHTAKGSNRVPYASTRGDFRAGRQLAAPVHTSATRPGIPDTHHVATMAALYLLHHPRVKSMHAHTL